MQKMHSWQSEIKYQGGDPELYEAALAKVGAEWSRTECRGDECSYIKELAEMGVIEERRVETQYANGSPKGSYCEFRQLSEISG